MAAPGKRSSPKKKAEPEAAPRQSPAEAFAPLLGGRHARLRDKLAHLSTSPPQVLLLEGGSVQERTACAFWWAALLNCAVPAGTAAPPASTAADAGFPGPATPARPCAHCQPCSLIANREYLDLFFFDGREGSIKIDEIRELRAVLAEAPRCDGLRVAVFAEAQSLGIEAANALLKSLEEPQAATCFVLCAPQRERLLPTLVSRSFTITLPWPPTRQAAEGETAAWVNALARFCATGNGWLERTEKRGALTPALAQEIALEAQKALAAAMLNENGPRTPDLTRHLLTLSPQNQRRCAEAISIAQDALQATVNPALTLDWLATRLFLISRAKR